MIHPLSPNVLMRVKPDFLDIVPVNSTFFKHAYKVSPT